MHFKNMPEYMQYKAADTLSSVITKIPLSNGTQVDNQRYAESCEVTSKSIYNAFLKLFACSDV